MLDLQNLQKDLMDHLNDFSSEEQKLVISILEDLVDGSGEMYKALLDVDFEIRPPTIDEFLESDEYLGAIGVNIYPQWKNDLRNIFKPGSQIFEWILTGALGTGKSLLSIIASMFKVTRLICMRNPQQHYGFMNGTPIVFGFFHITKYLANDVGYRYFESILRITPFFKKYGRRNKLGKLIGLPKNIFIAIGAEASHALGQNLVGGHLDEVNWKLSKDTTKLSDVQKLYVDVRDRIASRLDLNPGFLAISSSKRDQSDFLESHIEKVKGNPGVYISDYALWDVKTHLQSEKKFWVFAGNELSEPKVLEDSEVKVYENSGRLVAVPDNRFLRERFSESLPDALRNFAGVGTAGNLKLIYDRDLYWKQMKNTTLRKHPFTFNEASLGIGSGSLVEIVDKPAIFKLTDKSTDMWVPRFFRLRPRTIHVDLSRNKDRAGIAMGCIKSQRYVEKTVLVGDSSQNFRVSEFLIWIDFVLVIRAKSRSRIDYEAIRDLIFYLKSNNFCIDLVSYDQYQSEDSVQLLEKSGVCSKWVSVDSTKVPYYMLRSAILSGRLDMYNYPIFNKEMLSLEDQTKKVDHPQGESKDASDSVAGVVYNLMTDKTLSRNLVDSSFDYNETNIKLDNKLDRLVES